jgi:hypothetical protein
LWLSGIFSPVLVCCTEKNVATMSDSREGCAFDLEGRAADLEDPVFAKAFFILCTWGKKPFNRAENALKT